MADPKEMWVIDSSSIIDIKKIPNDHKDGIIKELEALIVGGSLVYPSQVVTELENDDGFAELIKKHKAQATRHEPLFDQVKELLKDTQIRRVLDHTKVGKDEADPYLLALALLLKSQGIDVTLITEEKKDRPDKLSLSSACGIKRVYSVPILPFLEQRAIYPKPTGP